MKEFKENYVILAGIDGCRNGWCVALGFLRRADGFFGSEKIIFCREITDVFSLGAEIYAIDIPIGLPAEYTPGGRTCDRLARKLLGPRHASIFNPPPRKAFNFKRYEDLRRSGIKLSRQSFNLLPRVRELDFYLRKCRPQNVYETHPELVFLRLYGNFLPSKHTPLGAELRFKLLMETSFFSSLEANIKSVKKVFHKDVLDAYACLLTAKRIFEGKAQKIPEKAPKDNFGLEMAIWF